MFNNVKKRYILTRDIRHRHTTYSILYTLFLIYKIIKNMRHTFRDIHTETYILELKHCGGHK